MKYLFENMNEEQLTTYIELQHKHIELLRNILSRVYTKYKLSKLDVEILERQLKEIEEKD